MPGATAFTVGGQIYLLFKEIQEIIGDKTLWPRRILKIFWKRKNITHWERVCLSAFIYVNGLNPRLYEEWAVLRQIEASSARDILSRLHGFEFVNNDYNLYAFQVTMGRYEDLKGKPRYY